MWPSVEAQLSPHRKAARALRRAPSLESGSESHFLLVSPQPGPLQASLSQVSILRA